MKMNVYQEISQIIKEADGILIGRAVMESENPKALAQKWKELYQA